MSKLIVLLALLFFAKAGTDDRQQNNVPRSWSAGSRAKTFEESENDKEAEDVILDFSPGSILAQETFTS